MSFYDAKQPMPDRQLINLAQHRLDRTARGEATSEDFKQLRDIFPALLGRFRSMVDGEPVSATIHTLPVARLDSTRHAHPIARHS